MPWSQILNVANMSFKAIRENKILAKISEFSVYDYFAFLHYCAVETKMHFTNIFKNELTK